MPDALTWYAAVAGSGATLIAGRREILQRRKRIAVDHGWRYFSTDESPPQFDNLHCYIMVTNTGGRNMVVQHVGWEFLADTGHTSPAGDRVLVACRVEVPLENPVAVEPDGVPLKVSADAAPLFHLFDPIDVNVRPLAYTGGGNVRWEGPWGPLMQRIPVAYDMDRTRARIEELKAASKPPKQMGNPELFFIEPEWAAEKKAEAFETTTSLPLEGKPTPPPL